MGKPKGKHYQARLSPLQVNKFIASKVKGEYADGGNLYLQITKTGCASWIFKFQRDGRKRKKGLGPFRFVSLEEARCKAREAAKKLYLGLDPMVAEPAPLAVALPTSGASSAPTFKACALEAVGTKSKEWKNGKSAKQALGLLNNYAFPVIGHLPVDQIDTKLVMAVVQPIWETKTGVAQNVLRRLRHVLSVAKTKEYRKGDNPARWEGHLENLLPTPHRIKKTGNYPALPYAQTGAFIAALRNQKGTAARALEFLILTAPRSGSVRQMRVNEIDLEGRCWASPEENQKTGKVHFTPLCDRAIEILKEQGLGAPDDFVFPGRYKGAMSEATILKVTQRMNEAATIWVDPAMKNRPIVPHGFRSTFRSWAAAVYEAPRELAEMALAHTIQNAVERAYQRDPLFQRRVKLMDAWGEHCKVLDAP